MTNVVPESAQEFSGTAGRVPPAAARWIAVFLLSAVGAGAHGSGPFDDLKTYNRSDWSRTVTECDRMAGHPNDPEAVTDGIEPEAMDFDAAIAACRRDLADDPDNPRLNYQLARAYGYAGRHEEGQSFRDAALRAGYPQSLFVVGYIRLTGWDGRGKDPCYGGELIRRSAHAGRFAGLVGFPHYALAGEFDDCNAWPEVNRDEMLGFLERAVDKADGFYQKILVEQLTARVEALSER